MKKIIHDLFRIGYIDLLYNLLNPRINLRNRISRVLCRSELLRDRFAKYYGKTNIKIANDHEVDGIILKYEESSYLNSLNESGYSLGLCLSPSIVSELINYCNTNMFAVSRDRNHLISIDYEQKSNPIASAHIYSIIDPHLDSTLIDNIARDRRLLNIASKYLGCEAKILTTQFWYTFPNKNTSNHIDFGYHIDLDDIKFLKLFFYLDDVNSENGPHYIISGTNRGLNIFKFFNRQISHQCALRKFSKDITMILGAKGEGFFEDTFTYHKGTSVDEGRRLLFQIEYGVSSKQELRQV